MHYSYFPHHVF